MLTRAASPSRRCGAATNCRPHGRPCESDMDCSLNGKCGAAQAGKCSCGTGWHGARCELLKLAPVDQSVRATLWPAISSYLSRCVCSRTMPRPLVHSVATPLATGSIRGFRWPCPWGHIAGTWVQPRRCAQRGQRIVLGRQHPAGGREVAHVGLPVRQPLRRWHVPLE